MELKVLCPSCYNCQLPEENLNKAVKELGIEAKVEETTDMFEIVKYTMSTAGLLINGKLKRAGRPLPTLDKVKELIRAEV